MDLAQLRAQLGTGIPGALVDELLEAHQEARRAFYLGGLRLAEVEGGRFCEAAFRVLQHITSASFTPLGKQLDSEKTITALANLPSANFPDSIRLHIPRSLRLVYDIRNKRDAAHLSDGIDPNLQDATLVVCVLDWVLAELLRLYHNVTPNEASRAVQDLVERCAPVVQDFEGFLKVLNPTLRASEHCLVLLYQCGGSGATIEELTEWSTPPMRPNLRRTLNRLTNEKAFLHIANARYRITRAGELEVERRRLLEPGP